MGGISKPSAVRPVASRRREQSQLHEQPRTDRSRICRRSSAGVSTLVRAVGCASRRAGSIGCTGHFVDAVGAVVEPLQRGLDLDEVGFERLEDRQILLALERVRRGVGRVLVVVRRARRPDRPRSDRDPRSRSSPMRPLTRSRSASSRRRAASSGRLVEGVMHARYPRSPTDRHAVSLEGDARAQLLTELAEQLLRAAAPALSDRRFEHALRVERAERRGGRDLVDVAYRVVSTVVGPTVGTRSSSSCHSSRHVARTRRTRGRALDGARRR